MKMTTNSILVSIGNYNFSDNADLLKNNFSQFFDSILIDSSSDIRPQSVDFVIPNNFYTGLWNESVKLALEKQYEWLFFIASDITLLSSDMNLIYQILLQITNEKSIGVYSPSVDPQSRCYFHELFNTNKNTLREIPFVEGFIFLARTDILKKMYPVDHTINKYGWSLDKGMCHISRKLNYKVVVDDRIIIHHPKSVHPIDMVIANQHGEDFYINTLKNYE